MSFRDSSWSGRFAAGGMGDEAERIFELTYPQNWDRFGLDRATINLANVPGVIRFSPDYITAKGFVEVQGLGRDQKFKLKDAKHEALRWWHSIFRTDLFIWDSHNSRYGWVRLMDLWYPLKEYGTADSFDAGRNPYRWLKANQLPVIDGWVPYEPELVDA